EIGPGLGVLTRLLAERAKRVIAIESDRRFAAYLRRRLPQVEVIQGDALRVDWPRFDVMTSNLPYQISSPLTFRLLDHAFDRAVLDSLYAHRLKTVENGLRLGWTAFARSREELEALLPSVPHRTRRVGELSPEEIARIAEAIPMAKG